VIVSPKADSDRVADLKSAGAEIVVADDVDAALSDLGRRVITSLFLEGGRTLAAAFATAGQIDEARVFVAPILLAGNERLNALGPNADDTLITTRFKEW
jgi:diaminohydroxyphosphoribosylaminopyrimidine deaminase/5-amino-6-(5-phosphoribosylamino)uracil reductase